jgi:hypothetical protein
VSEWKYEVITVQRAIVVKDIDPLEKAKRAPTHKPSMGKQPAQRTTGVKVIMTRATWRCESYSSLEESAPPSVTQGEARTRKAIRRRVSQLLGGDHLMLRRSLANRPGMLCNQVFCGSLTVVSFFFGASTCRVSLMSWIYSWSDLSDWWSSESASEGVDSSLWPLWTLRWRRRLETTEKWRPQPSTSHANAAEHC